MMRFWIPAACRDARAGMLEGIEGALSVTARLDVEDHVAVCAHCAGELADLAAAHHAVRRSYEPYRRARTSVAPGRARLRARTAWRTAPLSFLTRLGRRAEPLFVVAVLALAFLESVPGTPRVDELRSSSSRYVRAADDPGGLVRVTMLTSDRIPLSDALVIEVMPPALDGRTSDRAPQGLQAAKPD